MAKHATELPASKDSDGSSGQDDFVSITGHAERRHPTHPGFAFYENPQADA
jgi:hypothetical protein